MSKASTIIAVVCLIAGCTLDPPHDNPLDPGSPRYTGTGAFSGHVTLANFPEIGMPSIHIRTEPATFDVLTDSTGYYEFSAVPSGAYRIIASGPTISPDTIDASIPLNTRMTIDFRANALPVVTSEKILMKKIDQWWPNPVYSAEITASVSDRNGQVDIDSVWFAVDSLTFPMSYSLTEKTFQATLVSHQLPSNNIEWLVGKALTVVARDIHGSTGRSSPFYVSRMIEDEALPVSPQFQDTVLASPLFTWTPPSVRFLYSYTLSVVRQDAGSETTVWTLDNVGSYLASYRYPSSLEAGSYFWTVAIVDEYGNLSRSKESTFIVR